MSFNDIRENKILAKNFGFTVNLLPQRWELLTLKLVFKLFPDFCKESLDVVRPGLFP